MTPAPLHEVPRPVPPPVVYLAPQWDSVPATLRRYARWLVWTDADGRKVPRAVRWPTENCDQSLSKNHCSWDTLRAASNTLAGPAFSCGKVDKDLTVSLIDLDQCRNPLTGVVEAWATEIIRRLNSYTEISPRGTGIHILVLGALPPDAKTQSKVYRLEIYDRKRYTTVTGHRLPDLPADLQPREAELVALYAEQQSQDYITLAKLFHLYRGTRAGSIDLVCPWADEHSTGDGPRDAAFELTDGKVTGFHCFHASHADKHLGDVRELFRLQKEKADKTNRRKTLVDIFGKLGVRFEHDVFAERTYLVSKEGRREVDDAAENRLFFILEDDYQVSVPDHYLSKVIDDLARECPVHPVLDYLGGLAWDRTPRIDRWLTTYGGATDTELTRAVSAIVLIAAVRRVRSPGCKFDEMLVLESPQGKNKSTALATLCPQADWFSDDFPLDARTKEVIERTLGIWILEASELSGIHGASKQEHLKAMMSRRKDGPVRMAYGHRPSYRYRHFISIGTTNGADVGYLEDPTGSRRFWPIATPQFDIESLRRDRDQLWAEAATREAHGESIRLPEKFWGLAGREQAKRQEEDPWDEDILRGLGALPPSGKGHRFTTDAAWAYVGYPGPERRTPALLRRLKNSLRRIGCRPMTVQETLQQDGTRCGRVVKGWGLDKLPTVDEAFELKGEE